MPLDGLHEVGRRADGHAQVDGGLVGEHGHHDHRGGFVRRRTADALEDLDAADWSLEARLEAVFDRLKNVFSGMEIEVLKPQILPS